MQPRKIISDANHKCKVWNKPTISELKVTKTFGGIDPKKESTGQPTRTPPPS